MRERCRCGDRLAAIEQKLNALLTALADNGDQGASRYLVGPARAIGRILGVHNRTVRKWAKDQRHPLKCFHSGKGLVTTLGLIDEWARERWS